MEEWKDIPGYEGIYQASNEGRIRSVEGKKTFSKKHGVRVWKQRIMKQKSHFNKKGRQDCRVELWKDGQHRSWLVARLVALTWCDGYKNGLTVNHIDGNYLNNRAENLEWISHGDNIRLAFDECLYPQKACVLISDDGERKHFRSQCQASRSLGRSNQYIANRVIKGGPIRSIDGRVYQIEFK